MSPTKTTFERCLDNAHAHRETMVMRGVILTLQHARCEDLEGELLEARCSENWWRSCALWKNDGQNKSVVEALAFAHMRRELGCKG